MRRRPTLQSKRRQRWPPHKRKTDSLQAIIAATDYLANSFWDKIHNPNPDKRLNETAYYDKVSLKIVSKLQLKGNTLTRWILTYTAWQLKL